LHQVLREHLETFLAAARGTFAELVAVGEVRGLADRDGIRVRRIAGRDVTEGHFLLGLGDIRDAEAQGRQDYDRHQQGCAPWCEHAFAHRGLVAIQMWSRCRILRASAEQDFDLERLGVAELDQITSPLHSRPAHSGT
jgi:hypothetical protein